MSLNTVMMFVWFCLLAAGFWTHDLGILFFALAVSILGALGLYERKENNG